MKDEGVAMGRAKFWLLICVLCLALLAVAFDNSEAQANLKEAVKSLGAMSTTNDFDPLYSDPITATSILIKELRVIHRGQYRTSEGEGFGPIDYKAAHVIWCIRALRALTGLNFRAPTKTKLDEMEAHFLGHKDSGEVSFFGTWMSRELSFDAPEDAQKAIIEKWRRWFDDNGKTHSYVNSRRFDDWYY